MNPAIGQIKDKARDFILFGGLGSLIAKPDSLHPPTEVNGLVVNFGHARSKTAPPRSDNPNLPIDPRILFASTRTQRTIQVTQGRIPYMTNKDSDGLPDNDGEDRSELAWTETEWEKYLSEHESSVVEYLKHYDKLATTPDRIDEVARRLNWEMEALDDVSDDLDDDDLDSDFDADWEPYTLHRNPVYISSKALYVSLLANWERIAAQPDRISTALGLAVQGSLFRGRENSLQAVQALDLGDYSLAICFFKRALRELNDTLSRLGDENAGDLQLLSRYREYAIPRLFDLREIWLRVMSECREAHGEE